VLPSVLYAEESDLFELLELERLGRTDKDEMEVPWPTG